MNDMIRVTTKGSWVTMIVKIRAGRSGARRAQSLARRIAASDRTGRASCAVPRPVLMVVMTPPPASCRCWVHVFAVWSSGLPGPVALGDVLRELLAPVQRGVDRGPPGDRG